MSDSDTPCKCPTVHVEVLNNELCLYEWTTKTVHALNAPAARVWERCDGVTAVASIIERCRNEFGPATDDVVRLAVAQLTDAGLLETNPFAEAKTSSRREVVKRLGLTAALLPVVSSIAAPSALEAQSGGMQTFSYTGGSQTFVVPAGETQLRVDVLGAHGGPPNSIGGKGGRVFATFPVTAGETLTVNVGGAGSGNAGGFNGGGPGGTTGVTSGKGGGGASDIRRGSTRLVVAGGGGGAGTFAPGGKGGGTVGGAGSGDGTAGGGGGGTQISGGGGGAAGSGGTAGSAGSSEIGGTGGSATGSFVAGGGGGGGGFFGGGGGGGAGSATSPALSGSGGGGSSYTDPSATNVTHTQGVGDFPVTGLIYIFW